MLRWAWLDSAELGSPGLGWTLLGSAWLGTARLSSGRLGLLWFGWAVLGFAAVDCNWLGSSGTDSGGLSSARLSLDVIEWAGAGLGKARLEQSWLVWARLQWTGMGFADFLYCLVIYIEVSGTRINDYDSMIR